MRESIRLSLVSSAFISTHSLSTMHEPLLIDSSGLGTMLVFQPILHMVIQLVEEKSTNHLFFVVEVFGGILIWGS